MAELIPAQRRQFILDQLRKHHVLSINDLVGQLACSHMTIRRDIAHLEAEGSVRSVSGGVRLVGAMNSQPSYLEKADVGAREKSAIAKMAASHLHENMTLFLDAGTTTLALVPYIKQLPGITVVTNDFSITQALIDSAVDVIHTGGHLDHANRSSVGHLAVATLKLLVMDIAFISTTSWDLEHGITIPYASKIEMKRQAMRSASCSVLLATSDKFGSYSRFRICELKEFDKIISDKKIDQQHVSALEQLPLSLELA